MKLSILSLICVMLMCFLVGAFMTFVVVNLKELNNKMNNVPKHHWSMGVYMNNIPQNEQNTLYLGSVPLKIYEKGKYSDLPVPRIGEEVSGVYYSYPNKFDMKGIVTDVHYNTDIDWIVVSCKCTEIRKNLK